MSTHVELRLPAASLDAAGSSLTGGATGDLTPGHTTGLDERVGLIRPLGLRPSTLETAVRVGTDVLALALTVVAVRPALGPAALWAGLVLASLAIAGLYGHRLRLSALDDIPYVVVSSTVGWSVMVLVDSDEPRRGAMSVLLGGMLLVVGRMVGYAVLRMGRSRGFLLREAVLVGGGARAAELATRIAKHPETGLRVRGVLYADRALPAGLWLSTDVTYLPDLIASGAVDAVIVGDASSEEERRVIEALRHCPTGATEVFVLPRLPEFATRSDDHVWGVPLERLKQRRSRLRMAVKRAGDVTIASAALLAVSPLVGLAALAVRLEMGPGVIYRQERVGRDGRRFQLLKLRSMRPLPEGSSSEWAPSEERTGRVGAFIRRYSIDELPQLVNVIRGDMSLVGPRPERPEYVAKFGLEYPSYCYRHRVTVGLTGLAAVEGLRGDTSIADRAYFDNWYIEHWSLWLDVKIMVRTASALLKGTGG